MCVLGFQHVWYANLWISHTLWAPAVFMGPICCLPCVILGPHCGTQVKRVKLKIRYEVELVNVLVMVGDLFTCVHVSTYVKAKEHLNINHLQACNYTKLYFISVVIPNYGSPQFTAVHLKLANICCGQSEWHESLFRTVLLPLKASAQPEMFWSLKFFPFGLHAPLFHIFNFLPVVYIFFPKSDISG